MTKRVLLPTLLFGMFVLCNTQDIWGAGGRVEEVRITEKERNSLIQIARTKAFVFVALSDVPRTPVACSAYEFAWRAQPAFHPESTITISARRGSSELTITYGDVRTHAPRTERLNVDNAASEHFCSRVLGLMMANQKKHDRLLFDGIYVDGSFRVADGEIYAFSFRSPNKAHYPRGYEIADAVFTLFESATVSCELNEYLEQLAIYFAFGLPVRVIPGTPFTIRFYGVLTINEEKDLEWLLSSIPTGEPIRLDFTNFNGMGTLLHPHFRRLMARPAIHWIASPGSAKILADLGVKSENIEIKQGPSCALKRIRFARR